ncbi:MAG: 2-hydroxyglutaryl-CoA dehydratase [Desulfobacterales bacterium CG23_combo_of_CG06-09_8_20_14_all_51_8]|nr:MAG: 2-hydroxyglutaryl-CoA dehydratase [Desulfobacterales bacterium CG23_combo_of_CG06-09_8_20_14_all_51_8]
MLTAGIDIGSITAKAAILKDGNILGTRVMFTGYNAGQAGKNVMDELIKEIGISVKDLDAVVATGYGRNSVDFATKAITEITCHGAGAHFLNPGIRFIIDIGGQDSKVIRLDEAGRVVDFAMNDKCAAGTGRFLEVMARAMEVDLDGFGDMGNKATLPSKISSICTVFAESEVISLISKGETRENIIAGIHESVASRVAAMARRVGVVPPVMMTGGVAKNSGAVQALERKLETSIEVSEYAQVNGAIGAAVLAGKKG